MKTVLNKMPAEPDEIKEIIESLQREISVKPFLNRVVRVFVQSHLYLNQWKAMKVDLDCLKRILAMIRRFEASGLQLEGKGLWILNMALQHSCDELVIDEATFNVLFDTLLRITVETLEYNQTIAIMLQLLTKFNASYTKLFETGKYV